MNIHEYQAKAVLKEFGVPVPRGKAVVSAEEAEAAAKELGGPVWVVKSQIHAGGRGKGRFKEAEAGDKGGVRLAEIGRGGQEQRQPDARPHAGHDPDRPGRQGGQPALHRGRLGHRLASSTSRRSSTAQTSRVAFVVSTEGGMDIEKVAHDTPEKILTFSVDPATGIMPHHGRTRRQGARALGRPRQAGGEPSRQALPRPSSRRT